jgi:hypothetical protein
MRHLLYMYWDFYILVITKINLTRQMKIAVWYGKWEVYLTSWVMRRLSIKSSAKHVAADEIIVVFKQYVQNIWMVCNKNLQALWFCSIHLQSCFVYKCRKHAPVSMTATHAYATVVTLRAENVGQKGYLTSGCIWQLNILRQDIAQVVSNWIGKSRLRI